MELLDVYRKLLKEYGKRNWWPAGRDFVPMEWEICVGAILTQNTNWKNVEKALDNMSRNRIVSPEGVIKAPAKRLKEIIRPSGFYRQKAERLRIFAEFVRSFGGFSDFMEKVSREDLLAVKGIGRETADSILLYACGRPYFVIDAYTKRFVRKLGITEEQDYEKLRKVFEKGLPRDVEIYKEFHALIVEWGKRKQV